MERTPIEPHLSWSGLQPGRETDAYLLAMLVRNYGTGLDIEIKGVRDTMAAPSVLTTQNLPFVAMMYAFYQARMDEAGARTAEDMLKLVKSCEEDSAPQWVDENAPALRDAEAELLEYVDTPGTDGFRCFG